MPLNTFKFLGASYVSWSDLPYAVWNGVRCLFGYNSITTHCWVGVRIAGLPECDNCVGAWLPLVSYLCFNLFYNIFIVMVIKHGSAALMYIVMTVRLPLVQIAFSLKAIVAVPDHFRWYSFVGLAFILGGLIMYRWSSVKKKSSKEEDVVVVNVGQCNIVATHFRRKKRVKFKRDAGHIRSTFYGRLGLIDSRPAHLRTPASSKRLQNPII